MKRLYVGMPYQELVEIMGKTEFVGTNIHSEIIYYSYNVNFEYNCGIDVTVKDGKVVSIFEYN